MISYLLILQNIKLFEENVTLFCCLVFSLQHIGKFYHRLPWKCFIQPLYLFFYVSYKLFHIFLASVHFQGVRDISIGKCTVYTPSLRHMCVYLFCIPSLTFSLSLPCIHPITILLINCF